MCRRLKIYYRVTKVASALYAHMRPHPNQLQNAKESTPEAIVIDNETVFRAEKILKHRKRNGKVEYLVKWLFFPKSQSTWEPEHHILAWHVAWLVE